VDWNVVVTAHDKGFDRAEAELRDLGEVGRTDYYNVLVLRVEDRDAFLEALDDRATLIPDLFTDAIARVAPAQRTIEFEDRRSFEETAAEAARAFAPRIAGRSFYVRVHRRGMKRFISSDRAERVIADAMLEALADAGESASVAFDDPDAVLAVETVGRRAGLSVWTREELEARPYLDPG